MITVLTLKTEPQTGAKARFNGVLAVGACGWDALPGQGNGLPGELVELPPPGTFHK